MCNYGTNFAKTGNPNGLDADGTPMPEWTAYTKERPLALHLYDEITMEKPEEADRKREILLHANWEAYEKQAGVQ